MKHIFTLFLIAASHLVSLGQQPAQYSLYMMNKLNWNPAYAGLDHSLSITGIFRKQWVGLEDSPVTQNLNVHMPFYFLSGGIGLNLENDELGAERITSASLAYNYQKYLGQGILSVGLSAGIVQRTLDGSKLRTPEGNYENNTVINHNDDILPVGSESATATAIDIGVYYQSEFFELGLSAKNVLESSLTLGNLDLQLSRNYFLTLAVNFDLNRSISLHPSIMVRSDIAQTQIDFTAIAQYNDNVFVGAALRGYNANSIDAVSFIGGFKLSENITLAYAYDLTLSDLNLISNGSHEIMLNYNLNKPIGKGKPPRIIYNPRSL